MKKLIVFLFALCYVAQAQEVQIPTGAFVVQHTMKLDTLTNDSTRIFTLPQGSALVKMWMVVDSAGGESGPIKIGIRGEELLGRFLSSESYTFVQGAYSELPVETSGLGYICDTEKLIYVYTGSKVVQLRIIIEYRQL
jgi:hypothetical protein